jgi:PKD repeat protein
MHYKTGTLIGKTTQVLFQPIETIWRFGDGGSSFGPAAAHSYSRVGIFEVEATVTYAVSYQIAGASIWVESGSIELSDSLSMVVTASTVNVEQPIIETGKRIRIVGKNCNLNPGTFGCDG